MSQAVYIQSVTGDAYKALPVRRIDDATEAARIGARNIYIVDPAVVGPYGGQPIRLVTDASAMPVYVTSGTLGTFWDFPDLGADRKAFWQADDLANGAVSSWADTVAALTPVQATGAAQPVKSATAINGYPGVTFDGTDDYLGIDATTGLPTGATPGEIWVLASPTSVAANKTVIDYGNLTAGQRRIIRKNTASDAAAASDGSTGASSSGVVPYQFVGPHVVGAIFNADSIDGRMDGTPFAFGNIAATLATGTTRLRIGSNSANNSQFYLGSIRYILITLTLSAANRERVEAKMLWNTGLQSLLPSTHTYRFMRP